MNSFPSSDFFSSIDTTKRSLYCEYCGLRYQTSQSLANHQLKFCTGKVAKEERDFTDDLSFSSEDNKSVQLDFLNSRSNFSSTAITSSDLLSARSTNSNHSLLKKMSTGSSSSLNTYVCRLRPNQDLFKELDKFVKENDLKAAFIMTCVGSLTKATLRMAFSGLETNEVKVLNQHMEIVSLVGTLSSVGGHHLHISLSDKNGNVIGGHVFGECNVFTTAEIVIGECADLAFKREFDNQSGFEELVVNRR